MGISALKTVFRNIENSVEKFKKNTRKIRIYALRWVSDRFPMGLRSGMLVSDGSSMGFPIIIIFS